MHGLLKRNKPDHFPESSVLLLYEHTLLITCIKKEGQREERLKKMAVVRNKS